MKVIQVMPEFGLAGAEVMCENLCYELQKNNIDVLVVSFFNFHSAITERLENAGIRIIYLNKKKGLDLSTIKKLRKVFNEEKPDVIHTHRYVMEYAVPASIGLKVKRIHTVHNVAEKEVPKKLQKLSYLFYHAFHVVPVALSGEVQTSISKVYRIPPKSIPVIFNGINLDKCIPKESYEDHGQLKILHIGRFNVQKNHRMLVEAFKEFVKDHPNSQLTLIGGGELEPEIRGLVEELGLHDKVSFAGLKSDVYPYLHDADVFVLPSNYEGMPITLIEAMGTGLPIIATGVGGIPTMIKDDDNGLLIDNNKPELVAALEKMTDNSMREKLGRNARQVASRNYSSNIMARKYIKIYRR